MKKFIIILVLVLASSFVIAEEEINQSCTNDLDCKVFTCGSNSCVNINYTLPEGQGCTAIFGLRADYCKCEDNKCVGYKYECKTEQDCIDSGKCDAGIECTCSKNKCYTGLVEEPGEDEDENETEDDNDEDEDEDENETEDEKLERMLKAFDKLNYEKGVIIVSFTKDTTKEIAVNILNSYNLSMVKTEVCNPEISGADANVPSGVKVCWTTEGWYDNIKAARVNVTKGEEKKYAEILIKDEKITWVEPATFATTMRTEIKELKELRAKNVDELKEIIKQRREELKEEIKELKENQKEIYRNQNEVRVAVHALLAMKDLIGGIGPNVSAIARDFNNSIMKTINAEARLYNRSKFMKFWIGSDKQAIKDLEERINRSDELIAQLEKFKAECNCSDELKNALQEQIDLLKQEQDRLKLLIQIEKKKKGLFGWLKK